MVVGCWGPRQQGHTSSSDYVTPVTAAPVRGCTPNCLRKPAAGSHPSSGRGIPVSLFPFLKRTRTQEGCKVTGITHPPRPRVYPRQPSRACSLSYRPSCHSCRPLKPTSLAADQPLNDDSANPSLPPSLPLAGELRTRSTTVTATPAYRSPAALPTQPRPSLSLESPRRPLGSPGLTLQGAVRGHSKSFFFVFYFFSLFPLSLSLSLEKRDSFAQSIK